MSKTYFGFEGHYEVEDDGTIILREVDDQGKDNKIKEVFTDLKEIKNQFDKVMVEHLVQVTSIYKYAGRT
ncbi:MAG: hypothetical protein HXY49_09545 [Ignavibacteriaceae bacterium]|jgi:hypothetical protein|nr:hypothetical protein [Ignavibacteriaceae bacterium]